MSHGDNSTYCMNMSLARASGRSWVQASERADSRCADYCPHQGFAAGAARRRGIWLEPEPSLWPGSGSSLNFSLIIHANCMVHNLF